ncbi:MAG: c-type cytochrome [Phycisphaerales bacterium]
MNDWLHKVWFKTPYSDLATNAQGDLIFTGVDWVFMFILWISIISFLMLMIPMTWWAWKYRRSAGVIQQRTPNHNTALEVTWIVVPLIILTFLFFWGFHGYMKSQVVQSNCDEIAVTGQMWQWNVLYANGASSGEQLPFGRTITEKRNGAEITIRPNVESAPVVIVEEGKPVRFKMISKDVIHSFFIPAMRIKMDVFPNRYTTLSFTPVKTTPITSTTGKGEDAKNTYEDHPIYCAEYCGNSHSEMVGWMRVLPTKEFARTLSDWANVDDIHDNVDGTPGAKIKPGQKSLPLWQLGQWVYKSKGCASCHTVDGSKSTGPTWKDSYGTNVQISRGPAFDGKWDDYIRKSMLEPSYQIHAGFEGGNMPSAQGNVTDKQIFGVIAYFKHLAGKDDPSANLGHEKKDDKPKEEKK